MAYLYALKVICIHTQDDSKILQLLPISLKMKFTHNKYYGVLEQNHHVFKGCNVRFLDQITVKLREVFLMPGEVILRQKEMPRELCFVKQVRYVHEVN